MSEAFTKTFATLRSHVQFSLLRDMYKVHVHDQRFEYLAITFLLHLLVGYIVFTNENATYVAFLEFFCNL